MSLTRLSSFAVFVVAGVAAVFAGEINSPNVLLGRVHGDTACIITTKGVDWTKNLSDTTVDWTTAVSGDGYAGAYSGAAGLGKIIFCAVPADLHTPSDLLIVDTTFVGKDTVTTFSSDLAKHDSIDVNAVAVAEIGNAFWVGCSSAGVLRLDSTYANQSVFEPGFDKRTWPASDDSVAKSLDSAKGAGKRISSQINMLTAGAKRLFVVRNDGLFILNPADTTWEHPVIKNKTTMAMIDVSASPDKDSLCYVLAIDNPGKSDSAHLYKYESGNLSAVSASVPVPRAMAAGSNGSLYIVDETSSELSRWRNNAGAFSELDGEATYRDRMISALGQVSHAKITDVSVSESKSDTALLLSSEDGIWFSTNENTDCKAGKHFHHITHKVNVGSDLSNVFAQPSILNLEYPSCKFVYNLGSDADVTIDIFDYNMDHVTRITNKSHRQAGDHSGDDVWDGTVGGRTVSPGVYYFVVSTNHGKRGFGKIIVAKN